MGKSRSACVREAIAQYVQRFSNDDEARRQSILIAEWSDNGDWSERLPDWADWTACANSHCPLTSTLLDAPLVRIPVDPSDRNGLRKPSQLMADKLFTVPMSAIPPPSGKFSPVLLTKRWHKERCRPSGERPRRTDLRG